MGSKNKKHLRSSTQTIIHPMAIILTTALQALLSIEAYMGVLWPSYCLFCVSYISTYVYIE